MSRTTATPPEGVAELCLLRFGIQARALSAVPYVYRLRRVAAREAENALAAGAGLLHSDSFRMAWNHVGVFQYWRSFDDLEAWSHRPPHSDWWRGAAERLRTKADIGLYHETYLVPRGRLESIFMNAFPTGLLAFGTTGEPVGAGANGRGRLGRMGGKTSADQSG